MKTNSNNKIEYLLKQSFDQAQVMKQVMNQVRRQVIFQVYDQVMKQVMNQGSNLVRDNVTINFINQL